MGTYFDVALSSGIFQLHNPYLATPLSIEAYRNATGTADRHRQNVIAWLDRMQSSALSGSAENTPQLGVRDGKGSSQSEESDKDQASQKREKPHPSHETQDWKPTPASLNTLVESNIDTYPVSAAPIGLLASFADTPSEDAKLDTYKQNSTSDDGDVVRISSCLCGPFLKKEMGPMELSDWLHVLKGCREQGVFHARPCTGPRLTYLVIWKDGPARNSGV